MIEVDKDIVSSFPPSPIYPEGAQETVNILLVDDRVDGIVTLEAVLKRPDYNLVVANSGRDAILRVRERPFACILLDVQMPGMDGFETARRIRGIESVRSIPIIFVTAISKDIDHVYQGYESGAVDYIFKPFDPRILASKVSVFVDLHRKSSQIERQAEALREWERSRFAKQVSRLELQGAHRYKSLVDSIPHTICVLDKNRSTVLLNRTWFDLTGYTEEVNRDHGWKMAFPPEDLERLEDGLNRTHTPGDRFQLECRLLTASGELRWHLISVEAQGGPEGDPTGWLITATDVHRLKQTEIENARLFTQEHDHVKLLEQKKVALERSNHDLEQFAYVASHDLQEPLRKVTTFMDLLTRRYSSVLPEEAQKFVNFATDGATRMHDLIQGLLAYSRVDRAQEKALVNSGEVLSEVVADLAHTIRECGGKVTWDALPTVKAEATQLRQVFQNLIGNALKFCGANAPEIHVNAVTNDEEWVFSVQDNGIGIEKEYADRIFLIFQRLHPQGRYPGSGIGLAICKKIVERHDGRIWFESEQGKGTTFHFTIGKR